MSLWYWSMEVLYVENILLISLALEDEEPWILWLLTFKCVLMRLGCLEGSVLVPGVKSNPPRHIFYCLNLRATFYTTFCHSWHSGNLVRRGPLHLTRVSNINTTSCLKVLNHWNNCMPLCFKSQHSSLSSLVRWEHLWSQQSCCYLSKWRSVHFEVRKRLLICMV